MTMGIVPKRFRPGNGGSYGKPRGFWQDKVGKLFHDSSPIAESTDVRNKVVVCHDHDTILFADSIQLLMRNYPGVPFERCDIDTDGQARKARHYMLKFGTKVVPFCGVLTGKRPVKGFYQENGECTVSNVTDYVRKHFTVTPEPDEDTSFGEQLKMFFERE